ncbi:MAG: hypothetical protein KAW09_01180 [Thermoplasmata archaeon]|nr:hypothetical protein [Thermoplasmata archaeon]
MIESEEISDLQNRLDWIIGRRPAVRRRRIHPPIRITEHNVRALFNMSMKELLYALCRELDYVVVKKKSSIEVIK